MFQLLNDFFEHTLFQSKSLADCGAVFRFCRKPSSEFRLRYQPFFLIIYLFQQLYTVTRFFSDIRNSVLRPCGTCISAVGKKGLFGSSKKVYGFVRREQRRQPKSLLWKRKCEKNTRTGGMLLRYTGKESGKAVRSCSLWLPKKAIGRSPIPL